MITHTEKAPAKVNLSLHVGEKRTDGFHEIVSVLHMVDLHDKICFRVDRQGRDKHLLIDLAVDVRGIAGIGKAQRLPTDEQNIALKAARLLENEIVAAGFNRLHMHIEKHIPIAAGLAGGSADAAAVLRGLNKALSLNIPLHQLAVRSASLGSDVPACVLGGTIVAYGRGERVQRIPSGSFWFVLASPGGELSAGEVYGFRNRSLTEGHIGDLPQQLSPVSPVFLERLRQSDARGILPFVENDLQSSVFQLHPATKTLVKTMKEAGLLRAIVSGSGPTVMGIAPDENTAKTVARQLQPEIPWVWWGESEAVDEQTTTD